MSFSRKGAIKKSVKQYGALNQDVGSPAEIQSSEETPTPLPKNTDKIKVLKKQVSDVKRVMKDNIEKVVDRENKVGDLRDRTDYLTISSHKFKNTAVEVRKESQRKNWKLTCCIVCVVLVVVTIITIIILYALKVIKF